MPRRRPTGVIIIAILQILDGLWGLISGCALLAGGGALAALIATVVKEAPGWLGAAAGGIFAIIGLVLIFFALLDWALAWGVWALRRWAWWVTMIKAVLSILGPLVTLLGGNVTSVPTLILNAIIIALLFTPEVQWAMGIHF